MNFWTQEAIRESARKQINAIQACSFPNMEKEDRALISDSLYALTKEEETQEDKEKQKEAQEKEWAEAWKMLGMRFGRVPESKG